MEVFVDLRDVPQICMEALSAVTWELVRMPPTAELVWKADYPQYEGSLLPGDFHLGSACTMGASQATEPHCGNVLVYHCPVKIFGTSSFVLVGTTHFRP